MKTDKNFPNGFSSWMETHHEVVSFITADQRRDEFKYKVIEDRYAAQGTGGMYELAEELTDKFETINKGREWNGEFFDEIGDFLHEELS